MLKFQTPLAHGVAKVMQPIYLLIRISGQCFQILSGPVAIPLKPAGPVFGFGVACGAFTVQVPEGSRVQLTGQWRSGRAFADPPGKLAGGSPDGLRKPQ